MGGEGGDDGADPAPVSGRSSRIACGDPASARRPTSRSPSSRRPSRHSPTDTAISAGDPPGGRAPATTSVTAPPAGSVGDARDPVHRNVPPAGSPSRSDGWKPRRSYRRSTAGVPTAMSSRSRPIVPVTLKNCSGIGVRTTACGTRSRVASRVRRSNAATTFRSSARKIGRPRAAVSTMCALVCASAGVAACRRPDGPAWHLFRYSAIGFGRPPGPGSFASSGTYSRRLRTSGSSGGGSLSRRTVRSSPTPLPGESQVRRRRRARLDREPGAVPAVVVTVDDGPRPLRVTVEQAAGGHGTPPPRRRERELAGQ